MVDRIHMNAFERQGKKVTTTCIPKACMYLCESG